MLRLNILRAPHPTTPWLRHRVSIRMTEHLPQTYVILQWKKQNLQ